MSGHLLRMPKCCFNDSRARKMDCHVQLSSVPSAVHHFREFRQICSEVLIIMVTARETLCSHSVKPLPV